MAPIRTARLWLWIALASLVLAHRRRGAGHAARIGAAADAEDDPWGWVTPVPTPAGAGALELLALAREAEAARARAHQAAHAVGQLEARIAKLAQGSAEDEAFPTGNAPTPLNERAAADGYPGRRVFELRVVPFGVDVSNETAWRHWRTRKFPTSKA